MRGSLFTWFLAVPLVLTFSACLVDRGGVGGDLCPDPERAATCDDAGAQLVTCAGGEPSTESCVIGCTPGAGSCWTCDPADVSRLCSSDLDALEGCGADGSPSRELCLGGCEAGATECNPCMDGTIVCDPAGTQLVSCTGGSEMRSDCEFLCNSSGAGDPRCNDCLPSVGSCQGDVAVTCGADGLIASSMTCDIGCVVIAESATCQSCAPGASRCEADIVMTCDATGAAETPSATCAAGACIDSGMGSAECGACMPGTSRCDGATEATVVCEASGMEATPVPCGVDEHCEAGSGGATASCLPNCVSGCDGDERVTCTPGEVRETCLLGCETTTNSCRVLLPSNVGGAVALDRGTSGLTVGMTGPEILIFDTDDGGRIDSYDPVSGARTAVRAPASGSVVAGIYHEQLSGTGMETPSGAGIPDLAVWVMDSLTVGAMGTIHFVGTRAAVVLVEGDVLVEGRINARAEWLLDAGGGFVFVRAPAGGFGAPGSDGEGYGGGDEGVADGNRRSGGAGGSFGSGGGRGGGAGMGAVTSDPGPTYGDADLVPLYGGSAGGAGADEIAAGGDGGGALQISAGGTLTVAVGAIIDVGGEGGYGASASRGGGGGGGAGGGLLLEAALISVAGIVGAPGGGGAGGTNHNTINGFSGTRWDPPTELRGLRGNGSGSHGVRGGHGSHVASGNADNGASDNNANGGGGGGGGGAGRIRLNVRPGTSPTVTGTLVPSATLSTEGEVGIR